MGDRHLTTLLAVMTPALAFAASGNIRGEVHLSALSDGKLVGEADRSGVVVYVTGFEEPAPEAHLELRQCGKRFVPSLVLIQAGQWIDFINDDRVVHNVFSPVDRLDMGRAAGGTRLPHQFKKPGVVDLYCDVHEEMKGTVIVFPNHAHAVTGADGTFRLDNVPEGKVSLFAWQPNGPPAQQEVSVVAGQEAGVTIELTEQTTASHLDRRQRPYSEHRREYEPDGGFATGCPDAPAPHAIARVAAPPAAPPAAPAPPAPIPGDVVSGRAQLFREAAELLDKAGAAKRRGDRSLAGRLFLSASTLTGPEALEDLAPSFQEGAPPLVTTNPTPVALAAPPQPLAVGNSESDTPRLKPEPGALRGELVSDGSQLVTTRAVVTLEPIGGPAWRPAPKQRVIEQRGRQFAPQLMVVPTGSTISFPNYDPVYHNVFSRSEIKPFDLGLFRSGFSRQMTFDKEGVFRLGCNIHSNMSAYVVVVSQPHYAVVDSGHFRFKNLKPGRYRLRAWSEWSVQPTTQEVVVKPGESAVSISLVQSGARDNPDKYGEPR